MSRDSCHSNVVTKPSTMQLCMLSWLPQHVSLCCCHAMVLVALQMWHEERAMLACLCNAAG
jgi:hypothetical protein